MTSLRIVTADQRLAEANGKTTVALFGPSGVGKTSQLMTLPPKTCWASPTPRCPLGLSCASAARAASRLNSMARNAVNGSTTRTGWAATQ
jgi:hypothetical protein